MSDELTHMNLDDQLPELPSDELFALCSFINRDKWLGIMEFHAKAKGVEKMILMDLVDEVVQLGERCLRLGTGPTTTEVQFSTAPRPTGPAPAPPFSKNDLKVALWEALAGTTLNTDDARELLLACDRLANEVMGDLQDDDEE